MKIKSVLLVASSSLLLASCGMFDLANSTAKNVNDQVILSTAQQVLENTKNKSGLSFKAESANFSYVESSVVDDLANDETSESKAIFKINSADLGLDLLGIDKPMNDMVFKASAKNVKGKVQCLETYTHAGETETLSDKNINFSGLEATLYAPGEGLYADYSSEACKNFYESFYEQYVAKEGEDYNFEDVWAEDCCNGKARIEMPVDFGSYVPNVRFDYDVFTKFFDLMKNNFDYKVYDDGLVGISVSFQKDDFQTLVFDMADKGQIDIDKSTFVNPFASLDLKVEVFIDPVVMELYSLELSLSAHIVVINVDQYTIYSDNTSISGKQKFMISDCNEINFPEFVTL